MMFGRLARRWLKFHAVGAMGIAVQLSALALLTGVLELHYLVGTALAVEAAILHNFIWHERWTWGERTRQRRTAIVVALRFLRFNLSTGLVSVLSNLVLMRIFVGQFGMHYLAGNLLTIAACSMANFLLSELFVFRFASRSGSRERRS